MTYLEEIGKRIKEKRILLEMTQEELAKKSGYTSRSSINKIELGMVDLPQSKISAIASALNVTPTFLMFGQYESTAPLVQTIPGIFPIPKQKKLPILGSIACGEPILAVENVEGYASIDEDIDADFCLRCQGDSMIDARIYDGDIVYIRQQPDVDNGEIAAVLIGDEATLKRVYKQKGSLVLQPANKAYEPMVYTGSELDEIRILGKAVEFRSRVR